VVEATGSAVATFPARWRAAVQDTDRANHVYHPSRRRMMLTNTEPGTDLTQEWVNGPDHPPGVYGDGRRMGSMKLPRLALAAAPARAEADGKIAGAGCPGVPFARHIRAGTQCADRCRAGHGKIDLPGQECSAGYTSRGGVSAG
jgi:hypothetical protein